LFRWLRERPAAGMRRATPPGEHRVAGEPLALSLLGHARVEEETLFQSYEKATGTLGPLRCLRHEHEQMERWIRALFRIPELDEMKKQTRALLDLTRRHLAREEQVMFTAAREALTSGVLAACGEEWAKFRGVAIGLEPVQDG